ncbi:MAG: response regulator [Polyangiales bacterium]|nr:response regulator [Myxococcales bacterium]
MEDDSNGRRLGKILLKQRVVTQAELDALLAEQRANPGRRLASVAASTGKFHRSDLLKALAEQHGIPAIDMRQTVLELEHLGLIPQDIARQHTVLPVNITPDQLVLAMADPNNRRIVEEIEFVTGRRVLPHVALDDDLNAVIAVVYQMAEQGKSHYVGPDVPKAAVKALGVAAAAIGTRTSLSAARRSIGVSIPPSSPPVVKAVSGPSPSPWGMLSRPVRADEQAVPSLPSQGGLSKAKSTGEPIPRTTKKRVLVVDDEPDIRVILRRILEKNDFDVIEAGRGVEALEMVRDGEPDLILLDAMLPEIHGFEICRRLKGSRRYGHIPIIMISAIYRGWRVAEDLIQSYRVDAFIEKPFQIHDVMERVNAALAGRDPRGLRGEPAEKLSAEAEACLEQGIAAYQAGKVDEAVEVLRRGLGADPLSFKLHYHLGLVFGRQEKVFEAIHELEAAVDLAPRHYSALKNLAVLYQMAGFKHKSVEMWERAIGSAPDEDTRRGIKEHLMALL